MQKPQQIQKPDRTSNRQNGCKFDGWLLSANASDDGDGQRGKHMIVTEIKEAAGGRREISIDGAFAFVLYKGELRSYHLEPGKEITENTYDEIVKELLPKRAKKRAMNLLKNRSYTVKQLSDKLREGKYTEDIIEQAISYVTSFHYLDDGQYAEDYITYHKEDRSRSRILQDLMKKGISKEQAIECYDRIAGEDRRELEISQIQELMKKKNFNPATADFKEKQKFSALLYRKGFQIDTIRCAISLDIDTVSD